MEHDLYKNMGDIDVCIEFDMFEVKVPIIFLGTVGFSLRREGRYTYVVGQDLNYVRKVWPLPGT
jgi:hypothetical protein